MFCVLVFYGQFLLSYRLRSVCFVLLLFLPVDVHLYLYPFTVLLLCLHQKLAACVPIGLPLLLLNYYSKVVRSYAVDAGSSHFFSTVYPILVP